MNPPEPTFDFVLGIIRRLAQAQIATWLCGGWAEELWGLTSPRPHQDVDLLYPAPNFAQLDQWLARTTDLAEIPAKRFSHKRAVLCEDIMIEIVLLEPQEGGGYLTNFFHQRYQLVWPHDTMSLLLVRGQKVPIASKEALRLYRQQHRSVAEAYQTYLREQF